MDGNYNTKIVDELFEFAQEIMDTYKIYPYVSFIVKNEVVISRGYNMERETKDVSMQGDVVAIRNAQKSLDTGSLTGYELYSLLEPTILGFDVAMWSGIRDFKWCLNSSALPNHYNRFNYSPQDYLKNNPGKIKVESGIDQNRALQLVNLAKSNLFYPDNLI